MLDNPLDFYDAVEDGHLIRLSPSMYDFLRNRADAQSIDGDKFVYKTTEADAVAVWIDTTSFRKTYYARQLFTVLYGHNCEGSITTTYVGHPTDVSPHPFAFALTEFVGTLEPLSFLGQYRFNSLGPIRKFIQYIESDLSCKEVSPEFEFLMHVTPNCYLENEEIIAGYAPLIYREQLPF